MKHETVRKKAKLARKWAHGHAERRKISDSRLHDVQPSDLWFSQIFHYVTMHLASQSQKTCSQEASQVSTNSFYSIRTSQSTIYVGGGRLEVQNNLISTYCMVLSMNLYSDNIIML